MRDYDSVESLPESEGLQIKCPSPISVEPLSCESPKVDIPGFRRVEPPFLGGSDAPDPQSLLPVQPQFLHGPPQIDCAFPPLAQPPISSGFSSVENPPPLPVRSSFLHGSPQINCAFPLPAQPPILGGSSPVETPPPLPVRSPQINCAVPHPAKPPILSGSPPVDPPSPLPFEPPFLHGPPQINCAVPRPVQPSYSFLSGSPQINYAPPLPVKSPFVFEDEFKPHLNELDALLADLQNTVTAPGSNHAPRERNLRSNDYATVNSHADHNNKKVQRSSSFNNAQPQSPTYSNEIVFNKKNSSNINNSPSSNNKMTTSLNNNLSELDTLLQDLSNSKYATTDRKVTIDSPKMNGYNGHSDFDLSTNQRPSVDSLLEQLNTTTTPNGDGQYVTKLLMEETTTTTTKTIRPTASSATKELDDLMASLSEFKVSKPKQAIESTATYQSESIYAKPNRNKEFKQTTEQLDCMLGTLQVEMSKQGVNTTQKGCCSACDKPIVGQVITALGKTWHPEHFTCTHCQQELGTRNFFERDGRPYCEPDYHNLFSPRCAYCNGPILDKCVTALEKTWHTEHFFCAQCGKQFGEEGFHERDGKPYCRDDYFNLFAPKCGACSRPIMENYVSALSSQWHADCFVCRDCRQPFKGGSFFDHEGQPYCETHYHAKRGSLCAGCHKPITGRCITAMFRKFHPEHFVCAFCLKQLNKGTFKEQNDKPYCHSCFVKLFG